MPAPLELVVVDELAVGALCPTPRALVELIGKRAHGDWDGDASDVEESTRVFPVQARRRDPRVRQPIHRDVLEDVVAREAARISSEGACDQLVTADVVVQDPAGQADR